MNSPANNQISNVAKHVLSTLEQDALALNQMLALLSQERACLESNNHKELETFNQQKSSLSNLLDQRAKQRSQQLQQLGLNSDNAQQWSKALEVFDKTAEGAALRNTWLEVEKTLNECNIAMAINEKIVATLLQSAKQFISALQGTESSANVYDSSGRSSASASSAGIIQV